MLSHAASSVVPLIPPQPSLVGLLGPVDGLHVLVIGPGGLEPMLELHRGGAAQVTAICTCRHNTAEPADAAIVPRLATHELADAAIALARRAIRPLNSLVVCIPASAPASLLAHTRRRMAEHGFSAGRAIPLADGTALVAELPLYGRLKCA